MSLSGFRIPIAYKLAAACCVLTLLSCGRSPTAPGGHLLVYVSENGIGPAPGKLIEIVGTGLTQSTDEHGLAQFKVHAGSYVVRAYEIGTPGPSRPFVEQSVEVESARTTRVQFNECTFCR
jgi:hypothetical protein